MGKACSTTLLLLLHYFTTTASLLAGRPAPLGCTAFRLFTTTAAAAPTSTAATILPPIYLAPSFVCGSFHAKHTSPLRQLVQIVSDISDRDPNCRPHWLCVLLSPHISDLGLIMWRGVAVFNGFAVTNH